LPYGHAVALGSLSSGALSSTAYTGAYTNLPLAAKR
jgi:hypothetical protein